MIEAGGITADVSRSARPDWSRPYIEIAKARLAERPEAELPEIQAWRRVYARMGLKPTQYRCAAESLLRRLRKEGALPAIHPLIDLANAVSAAFAIPVAVFDTSRIVGWLEVRPADGTERYETFGGEIEHPGRGEVVFADAAGQAHARRWTNRQSAISAVRAHTTDVLVVAEAVHVSANEDVPALVNGLARELEAAWPGSVRTATLTSSAPRFDF